MRYSNNADYLVASIIYLGTNSYYWGRTAKGLAQELGLDGNKLSDVFVGFPGIFRRTGRKSKNGECYYSLQARHAQRNGGDITDPNPNEDIPPLDNVKLDLLLKFVLQMTEQEKASRRAWWTTSVAVGAAVISAGAAVMAAFVKA